MNNPAEQLSRRGFLRNFLVLSLTSVLPTPSQGKSSAQETTPARSSKELSPQTLELERSFLASLVKEREGLSPITEENIIRPLHFATEYRKLNQPEDELRTTHEAIEAIIGNEMQWAISCSIGQLKNQLPTEQGNELRGPESMWFAKLYTNLFRLYRNEGMDLTSIKELFKIQEHHKITPEDECLNRLNRTLRVVPFTFFASHPFNVKPEQLNLEFRIHAYDDYSLARINKEIKFVYNFKSFSPESLRQLTEPPFGFSFTLEIPTFKKSDGVQCEAFGNLYPSSDIRLTLDGAYNWGWDCPSYWGICSDSNMRRWRIHHFRLFPFDTHWKMTKEAEQVDRMTREIISLGECKKF